MKILVTGGAGFIGSHIVDKLIGENHQVSVVDNLSCGNRDNVDSRASFYQMDIADKDKIYDLFNSEKFETVIHAAAQKNLQASVIDPQFDAKVNLLGSINLMEASRLSGTKKFVYLSSGGAMYGETKKRPTPENHPIQPIYPYGISKWVVEYYLDFYHRHYGVKYVSLRLSNVYGPRQDPGGEAGVVAVFFDQILGNQQPIINGEGVQTRDFVYVKDVADAVLLAIEKGKNGQYNVATQKETSVNELFNIIVKVCEKQIPEKHGPALPGEQMTSCLSYQKIKKDLGWQPATDLPTGLKFTKQWFSKKNE